MEFNLMIKKRIIHTVETRLTNIFVHQHAFHWTNIFFTFLEKSQNLSAIEA